MAETAKPVTRTAASTRRMAITIGLFVIYILLTLPYRSLYLYSWDSGNYVLGMRNFNTLFDRPQSPGYIIYIGIAKSLSFFVADANLALVLTSWLAGAIALIALGLTLQRLRVPATALFLLFFMTIPMFWLYNLVALPYAIHGCIYALLFYVLLRFILDNKFRYLLPVLYGLAIGLRQDALIFAALPIATTIIITRNFTIDYLIKFALLFAFTSALWGFPLILPNYRYFWTSSQIYSSLTLPAESIFSLGNFQRNRFYLDPAFSYGLPSTLFLLGVSVFRWRKVTLPRPILLLFLTSFMPPLIFYFVIHIGNVGYLLCPLFSIFILGAVAASTLPRRWLQLILVTGICFNIIFFLGTKFPLTQRALRREDKIFADTIQSVHQYFSPKNTILLCDLRYRRFIHYFPDFLVIWPLPTRPIGPGRFFNFILRCRNGIEQHQGNYFWDDYHDNIEKITKDTFILLIDEGLAFRLAPDIKLQQAGSLQFFTAHAGQQLNFKPEGISITETR